jgi:hypothetical protein
MPPAPARPLPDWQRETLLAWAERPARGLPPPANRRPHLRVLDSHAPTAADRELRLDFVIEDADGEPVIGVLKVGTRVLRMDRPGSFSMRFDTRGWAAGAYPISAVLCDGWAAITHDLGRVAVPAP